MVIERQEHPKRCAIVVDRVGHDPITMGAIPHRLVRPQVRA